MNYTTLTLDFHYKLRETKTKIMKINFLSSISGILTLLAYTNAATSNVKTVISPAQFYETCNRNDSYTVVKYYTSWCHHCKRLKPIFEEVSNLYADHVDEDGFKVNFLNVNCELFGSTLCADLPGFPIIELVKPLHGLSVVEEPLNTEIEPFWKRIPLGFYNWAFSKKNPDAKIGQERILRYQGRRDTEAIHNFIATVVGKDKLANKVDLVLDDDYQCHEDDSLCKDGKVYSCLLYTSRCV